jgi:hypothetical protein
VSKEVLPTSLAERANQLRSIRAHKSVLLVLEDVSDAAQVTPFLPNSQASAVLVTSSGRLGELLVDGAEPILLEPLDADDGAHLLRELIGPRAGSEPEAVVELVRQCAGLPCDPAPSAVEGVFDGPQPESRPTPPPSPALAGGSML